MSFRLIRDGSEGYGACDDARPHVALLKFPSADFLLHLLEKPSHVGGFSFCRLGIQTVINGARRVRRTLWERRSGEMSGVSLKSKEGKKSSG